MRVHKHVIDEAKRSEGAYRHYKRRFYHFYRKGGEDEKAIFSARFETIVKKPHPWDWFSARLSIGNMGSETPWDGHLLIFGIGFFWGLETRGKLASRITRCRGYAYDHRVWFLRISDERLWWEFANHDTMCPKSSNGWGDRVRGAKRRRRRTLRSGSINLSIPKAIWGPKYYTYDNIETQNRLVDLGGGEIVGVTVTLQKAYLGRTKVPKEKHILSWVLDVEPLFGIPTENRDDWKSDGRVYGFGVAFQAPGDGDWGPDADRAIRLWVEKERALRGYVREAS